ncbi:hypothetical protein N7501_004486 [Penicillium viridicatum]|nr:hypothetical protein N7501_004486 [Penicillium viridicatum]
MGKTTLSEERALFCLSSLDSHNAASLSEPKARNKSFGLYILFVGCACLILDLNGLVNVAKRDKPLAIALVTGSSTY